MRRMNLSFCERDYETCAWERSGGSGLLCGAEISGQIWTWNVENIESRERSKLLHAIVIMQNTAALWELRPTLPTTTSMLVLSNFKGSRIFSKGIWYLCFQVQITPRHRKPLNVLKKHLN